jgi:2'-5' RNA ligase
MSHRTFIALDLDEAVRRNLAAMRDTIRLASDRGDKIHWVSPENYHVTLKFLGDVSDAQLADVGRAVQAVAAETEPFDFSVQGVRAIPPKGRSLRMVWAEVTDSDGQLADVFASLERALPPLGFARENRPFAQHITLARVKSVRDTAALRAAAVSLEKNQAGTVHARHVTVYTSRLTKGGPIYTPAVKAPLGRQTR